MRYNNSHTDALLLANANCVDLTRKKLEKTILFLRDGLIVAKIRPGEKMPARIPRKDLKGRFVLPGFIDSHTHLVATGIEMQRLDLSKCRTLDECLQRIAAQAKTRDIVFASNWDENTWRPDEVHGLDRMVLDRISRKKPLIMRRVCGHYAVVNRAALKKIDKHWKIVDRNKGWLYEDVALNLNDIFRPTDEMLEQALLLATRKALSLGITSVHEISNPRRFRLLQKNQKDLQVRFAVYLPVRYYPHVLASGLRTGYGNDWLKFAGIKIYMDGSLGARTAALAEPYSKTRCRGKVLVAQRRLDTIIRRAEECGIQLMIHSIGDRSSAHVLKSLKRFMTPGNPLRHRFEHLEILGDDAIKDIGRLKIIASMQPNFVRRWQNKDGMYHRLIGTKYISMNLFKSLVDARARVVFGSDCMPLGPLYGIAGAVRHPSTRGRIEIADAFRLYTEAGAFAKFDEYRKGMIEPGYLADIVVLNKNPLQEKNLNTLRIESVIVNGKLVK